MAELAYRRFDHKRDAYALSAQAMDDYSPTTDAAAMGALAALQAKSLIDMPEDRDGLPAIEPRIRERLAAARQVWADGPASTRELPRLDLVTGLLEYKLDAAAKAQPLFAQASRRCAQLGDWECYGTGSQNLAVLAEENGHFSQALAVYGEALRRLDSRRYARLVADIRNNLGRVQARVGLFSESQRSYTEAMRAYARIGDCSGVRRSLARIGAVLSQIGELADAEGALQNAASLDCPALMNYAVASLPTPGSPETTPEVASGTPNLDNNRADLCAEPIDPGMLGADNLATVFDALYWLHDTLGFEGETVQSQRCLNAARPYATDTRTQMKLASAEGDGFLVKGKPAAARSSFDKALRIADRANIPAGNGRRGTAQLGLVRSELLAKNETRALQDANEALHSSVARGDVEQTVTSLRLVASANTRRPDEAGRALEVAERVAEAVPIDELDGEKRATFLATQHEAFAQLTDLLATQASLGKGSAWQAFETSERGRARSLRFAESQQARDAAAEATVSEGAYGKYVQDIVALQGIPVSASDELVRRLGEVASHQTIGTPIQTIERDALTQTLGRLEATAVEYAVGMQNLFAFVVSAKGVDVVRLGDRDAVTDAATALRDVLRDPESRPSLISQASERLARLVIWPLRDRLATRRLIFVPDDALHTIPFAVLPWTHSATDLLVQHFETSVAPAVMFITRPATRQTPRAAPRIELIGDPVFRVADWRRECIEGKSAAPEPRTAHAERTMTDWTESLPRLPGSRAEISMVAMLARQARPLSHVETLLGCNAVASGLKAAASAGPDLLHIATHARVDAQRPRLSALALTPDPKDTPATSAFGLLDILRLRLNSKLVVLSACDTSRGKLLPGEGVLGPAQAFLEAGAAAVLASYWRIDDDATADFMQTFYRYLLIDHQSAGVALRHAQLDALRTHSPHVWAAFALYGTPDTLL
jgi:CHAT domain-containing protein